jgi:hypothetical protein
LHGVKHLCKAAKNKLKMLKPAADYDKLVLSEQKVKSKKNYFDWDAIGKMLTFKM